MWLHIYVGKDEVQDVFGFNVPMHESVLVHMIHSIEQLAKDSPGLVLGQFAALEYIIEQITALGVLHDEAQTLTVLHSINELDDMLVRWQLREDSMLSSGLQ